MIDLEIDTMMMADLDQVMEIEQASFSMPWSRWMFERELEEREHSHFLTVRRRSKVLGYIGCWIALGEAHIVTIAVRSDFRREGVGSVLMASALTLAMRLGANRATLEVRVTNLPAQRLYRNFGFEIAAMRKRFYYDTGEDAYVMWIQDLGSKTEEILSLVCKVQDGKRGEV